MALAGTDPLILLVDDAPDQIRALGEILQGLPCRLIKASSGAQALALALREKPDLILLDILMPGLDGLAVLKELKLNPATGDLPVIFLTAKGSQDDVVAGLEAGAADYIAKPFHGPELLARVRTHLGFKLARDRERRGPLPTPSQRHPETQERPAPRILVVDDSPSNLRTLIQFLREDYKILVATNGTVALELARTERPDLILLDVVMPDMDGYQVCAELKADPRTRLIPVIFVTGDNEEGGELKGFDLGAVDYITKPFSLSIVRARVKTQLELKQYRDTLELESMTDGLTGVPNRRYLQTFFDLLWGQSQRLQGPIAVILLDVDHFKAFNDHYGHLAGDDCLRAIARTLSRLVQRKSDMFARFGGEEFLCVLPATDQEAAQRLAEQMRAGVEALAIPHASSGAADHVTISLGLVACVPTAEDRPETLLERADQALYAAKSQGRNRWISFH